MFRSMLLFSGAAAALVVVAGTGCRRSDWAVYPALLGQHPALLGLDEEPDARQTVLESIAVLNK